MLVLHETPQGFALFALKNSALLTAETPTSSEIHTSLSLAAFLKFTSTTDALSAATALIDGKVNASLKDFLAANVKNDVLVVAESKLAGSIAKKLGLEVKVEGTAEVCI